MIHDSQASSWKPALGVRTARAKSRRERRRTPRLEALEHRVVLSTTYTMPLVNHTLLNPSEYSIYVDGFSEKSGLTLQPSTTAGVLTFQTQTGTMESYPVGADAGAYNSIQFDTSQAIIGARVYLYVVPVGQTAPSYSFGTQPHNPPDSEFLYSYVEMTQPSSGGPPTVDVATVDGFSFPISLTLNDGLGEVGQPTGRGAEVVTRPSIITRYQQFMNAPGRRAYKSLVLPTSTRAAGQSEGLLNPYLYLTRTAGGQALPMNAASPLNRAFDSALNTLFRRGDWSLMGVDGNVYTAKAGSYAYGSATNPVTNAAVSLGGIQLNGGGNTLTVFNPVGVNVARGANGRPIQATTTLSSTPPGVFSRPWLNALATSGTDSRVNLPPRLQSFPQRRLGTTGEPRLNQITLTNSPPTGTLKVGMYVFGTFFDQANGSATNYITGLGTDALGRTVVTLKNPLPFRVSNNPVVFSPLPDLSLMEESSGSMVFGGTGFFADAGLQGVTGETAKVLLNLENQIVSALNRGVAVVPSTGGVPGPLSASTTGYATQYWGTQTNWYPRGQPQNQFSLFMHTAAVDGTPIFVRPPGAVKASGGALMGAAYGFSYDENPGPVPPVPGGQPQVPSKFDPVPTGTTTITITLGPWFSIA